MAALNPRLADLSDDDRQVLDSWLVEFDQGWDEGLLANRLDQIPPGSSWRLPALAEMVKIDLQRQWRLGRQVSLESYLQEFPELGSPGDVSVDLIQAEYEVRRQFGTPLTLDDYLRRFPHQAGELARLIAQGGSGLSRPSSVAAASRSSSRVHRSAETPEQLPEQFGRYRIIKRLGQGGMGSVYLAQDTHLERPVALKVPDFGSHEDPEARRRFLEEARTAATLDHPYLCPVHDAGEIDGQPYLTMAYIEGQSLAALIGTEGWPQRQVAALVGKLALALQQAHTQKVVHRDLKPANVMIKTTGQRREPVIVDFGLAHRDNPQEQRLTRSGQVMGTLGYMAPEQIRGDLKEIGPACDIYALGVIFYELLTGRLPFSGSGLAIAGQILTQAPLPPSTHRSDLDPALEAICLKAMAKAVGDRYTSMAELAAALTGWLHSLSASPPPAAPAGSPASPSPASGEQPRPAGSNSLVGQFLAQLAENKASRSPIPTPEPVASRAPLRKRRRSLWTMIVASSVLVVILLSAVIYVATDKGRPKNNAGDNRVLSADADERPARAQADKPSVPKRDSEAPKDGFQPLFNGKDKTGWKTHPKQPGNWHVANGVLIGSGPALSHIYTDRGDYTDFHLRLEARFNQGGSSGVYLRCPFGPSLPADDPKWPGGYEATINNTRVLHNNTGGLIPGIGKNVYVTAITRVPFGEWFTLEVIADGNAFALLVNGKFSGYHVPGNPNLGVSSGHIALQQYSPESLIEFRKIEIKELNRPTQKDPKEIRCLRGHRGRVNRVAFLPDGLRILSGGFNLEHVIENGSDWFRAGFDNTVQLWEVASGRNLLTLTEDGSGGVGVLAISSDSRCIASSDELRRFVWDLTTGRRINRFPENKSLANARGNKTAIAFSRDDHRVMAAATNGNVVVWDLDPERELPSITLETGPVKGGEFPCAAFSSDRKHLITGSRTGVVELWDLLNGKKLQTFAGHTGAVGSVACSADGRLILSTGWDNTARLWDTSTGKELKQLKNDDRQVRCVAFSPDSRRALSAGLDGPVYLWDLASGKEVCRMEGHTMVVNSIAFSPDGRRAVSGSSDRTVRLWQLPETDVAGGTLSNVDETPTREPIDKASAPLTKAEKTPLVNLAPVNPDAEKVPETVPGATESIEGKPSEPLAASAAKSPARIPQEKPPSPTAAPKRIPPAGPARRASGVQGSLWTVEGDQLIKEGPGTAAVSFGDQGWTDYDLTFEARKSAGAGGAGVHFRGIEKTCCYVLVVGDRFNRHSLGEWSRLGNGGPVIESKPGTIQPLRWYKLKLSLRGTRIRIELDDHLLFDRTENFSQKGNVALKCYASAWRFRNIKVTAPDGTVLWEGPPDLGVANQGGRS